MTKLKENQLLISATGITIKTTVENIVTWGKCFTDHFKGNGYIVTKTKTLKEPVQIVMEKNISIQINFFHNGKIAIATEDTKSIIEETLPLIENELGISFENICKRRSTS